MDTLASRLKLVRRRVGQACRAADRDPAGVGLVAVSKSRTAEEVSALAALGQRDFGENYIQEALPKIRALAGLGLSWHFVGPLQSNKTRDVAAHFDWVHSLDRERLAVRLSGHRAAELGPLNVCIQVNVDAEDTKSGIAPAEVPALARIVAGLPRLRLRGLMAIPRPDSPDGGRAAFRTLAMTLSLLHPTIRGLDTLSMGMSDDFETAITEGATLVRLGTALFGPRPPRDDVVAGNQSTGLP